jgi:hypothetical protein
MKVLGKEVVFHFDLYMKVGPGVLFAKAGPLKTKEWSLFH